MIAGASWPAGASAKPGASAGEHSRLGEAAAVGLLGDPDQAGAVALAEPQRIGQLEQGLGGLVAGRARDEARAEDDHQRGVGAEQRRDRVRLLGARVAAARRRRDRAQEIRALAGRVARDRVGAAVERRRALGGDPEPQPHVADRLADAQVEDRHLVQRVGAENQYGLGVVDVVHARRERGVVEAAQRLGAGTAARAAVDVGRAERAAHDALDQVALLVRGPGAGERRRALAMSAQPLRRRLDRLGPGRRAQVAALADHRLGDAVGRVDHLVAEAALVAEPPVVDLVVVARQHPHDVLVADGELDVALARAERADRSRVLDVPGAGAEAVGLRRQGAHRAELDDVAVEGGDVGLVVEGPDEGAVAALEQLELLVLGDLLAEAHAAVAEDAALAVDLDERGERKRLLEVALGVGHAAAARAPAHRDVLERALAALVADGAVERVVDEQELDDRVLGLLDAIGLGVDDHPVAHRRRARGLELRDPLDLDQAHPAGADRLAELGLVTEDGDLDVAALRCVDEHRALGRRDLDAVDDQRHRLALALHAVTLSAGSTLPASSSSGPGPACRADSIAASNSSR